MNRDATRQAQSAQDQNVTFTLCAPDPGKWLGIFIAIWRDASRSACRRLVTVSAGGADLGVGDLVGEQGVDLGGLGRGVAQAAAHDLDGDAAVDQLGGVRVAELVDAGLSTSGNAVFLPPVVRRVVGQRAALAVDGTRGTAGPRCTRPGPGRAGAARRSPGSSGSTVRTVPPVPWMRACSSSGRRSRSSTYIPQTCEARAPQT
jgi:hypothetical protein